MSKERLDVYKQIRDLVTQGEHPNFPTFDYHRNGRMPSSQEFENDRLDRLKKIEELIGGLKTK